MSRSAYTRNARIRMVNRWLNGTIPAREFCAINDIKYPTFMNWVAESRRPGSTLGDTVIVKLPVEVTLGQSRSGNATMSRIGALQGGRHVS